MGFQAESPFPASIPSHSVDWRFLLPLDQSTKLLIVVDQKTDYYYSFQYLKIPTLCKRFEQLSELDDAFDTIAFPLGLRCDDGIERSRMTKSFGSVLHLLRPGGRLLVGFSNRWSFRRKAGIQSVSSTWRMRRVFSDFGLQNIQFFGALPGLVAPEFIFPLSSRSLSFILNHRYQHRFPKAFLALAKMSPIEAMMNFLPFYYMVAQLVQR